MAKPYDATARQLIEMEPAAWLQYLGIPVADPNRVVVIDSNLSTLTAEADKVLRIEGPDPWIEHVEIQASRDTRLEARAHMDNALLDYHQQLPVRTTLILLRPAADGPELTGRREKQLPREDTYSWFRYRVVRVREQPVDTILAAGLPVLPLAPVSDVGEEAVPGVLVAISRRLVAESTPEQAATLWTATRILLGLRYPEERIEELIKGVSTMILGIRGIEESSVYQSIFAKGRAEGLVEGEAKGRTEEARRFLMSSGRMKFGQPDEAVMAEITVADLDRLHSLIDRIPQVSSWDELLSHSPA